MKFRPCIDIHNGKVKQIVGGSLRDEGNVAQTNFQSEYGAEVYAQKYKEDGLVGGHIILLNAKDSEYYEATRAEALKALCAYPGGLQIGGGIHADNAREYLEAGASHVIVTSYVFQNGEISWEKLEQLKDAVGKERLVLDLSCRRKNGEYYIVTDRWQTFTNVKIEQATLRRLSEFCDEFLVHGVDVEGKSAGVEVELVQLLTEYAEIPVTYAGGIGSMEDLEVFRKACRGNMDFTVGSALDLFGGSISYHKLVELEG